VIDGVFHIKNGNRIAKKRLIISDCLQKPPNFTEIDLKNDLNHYRKSLLSSNFLESAETSSGTTPTEKLAETVTSLNTAITEGK
jgi:hypothetical protein